MGFYRCIGSIVKTIIEIMGINVLYTSSWVDIRIDICVHIACVLQNDINGFGLHAIRSLDVIVCIDRYSDRANLLATIVRVCHGSPFSIAADVVLDLTTGLVQIRNITLMRDGKVVTEATLRLQHIPDIAFQIAQSRLVRNDQFVAIAQSNVHILDGAYGNVLFLATNMEDDQRSVLTVHGCLHIINQRFVCKSKLIVNINIHFHAAHVRMVCNLNVLIILDLGINGFADHIIQLAANCSIDKLDRCTTS